MPRLLVFVIILAICVVVSECQWSSRRNSILGPSPVYCGSGCAESSCYLAIGCRTCLPGRCKTFNRMGRSRPTMCVRRCPRGKYCHSTGYCTARRG